MPDLADVARAVFHIQTHLVGKTIVKIEAGESSILLGKPLKKLEITKRLLTGKKILSVGRHGKYLYIVMSRPPHIVLHLGEAGWLMIKGVHMQQCKLFDDRTDWPPKYLKMRFIFNDNKTEAAFCDPRISEKFYMVDCHRTQIRDSPPICYDGPDAVLEKDLISDEWLTEMIAGRNASVKLMLMDHSIISGLGNRLADEVLYQAGIHPQTRSKDLTSEQISNLRRAILYVCSTAVDLLGIVDRMPSDWLIHHRHKKNGLIMESGEHVRLTKVGCKPTAYVPSVQARRASSGINIKK